MTSPNGCLAAWPLPRLLSTLGLIAFALGMSACWPAPPVVRVVDGQPVEGRFVRSDAYSLFLQGVIAEDAGQLGVAERLYMAAYRRDRQGVAILARLGAVRCAWGPKGYESAESVFEQALDIDPAFAPVHVERARCALRRGALNEAERFARRALVHAPDDEDVSMLLAEVLERKGEGLSAARVLDALAVGSRSERAWRAVRDLARRRGDGIREAWAERGVNARGASAMSAVDAALSRGDLEEARALATESGIDHGHLAVRAAALGKWRLAREQARTMLAADPGHPDATAALLASPVPQAAHRAVDPVIWRRLLRSDRSRRSRNLSTLGALVLIDALRRRSAGLVPPSRWRAWVPSLAPAGDRLCRSLRRRLEAAWTP